MNYSELLDTTGEIFKSSEGKPFADKLNVYREISALYARHMGLDEADEAKIWYLMASVGTHF